MFWIKIFVSILLTVSMCCVAKSNAGHKSIVVKNGKPILRMREELKNYDSLEQDSIDLEVGEWKPHIEASKLEASLETRPEKEREPMVEDDGREDETEISHPESTQGPDENHAPEHYWTKKVEEQINKMQRELGYQDSQAVIRKLIKDAQHYFGVRMKVAVVDGKPKLSVEENVENEKYPDAVEKKSISKKPKLETIEELETSQELKPQHKPFARAGPSVPASSKEDNKKHRHQRPSSSKGAAKDTSEESTTKRHHRHHPPATEKNADSMQEVNSEKNDHENLRTTEQQWMPHMKTFVRFLVDRFGKGDKLDARLKPVIRSVEKANKITIDDIDVDQFGEVLIEYSSNKDRR